MGEVSIDCALQVKSSEVLSLACTFHTSQPTNIHPLSQTDVLIFPTCAFFDCSQPCQSSIAIMTDEAIQISQDSDLLLIVTKGEDVRRFKVISVFLRLASKVFDTMLGPGFAEGQGLSAHSGSLHEVKLEDDDLKCMELILNFTHLQHSKLPERVD